MKVREAIDLLGKADRFDNLSLMFYKWGFWPVEIEYRKKKEKVKLKRPWNPDDIYKIGGTVSIEWQNGRREQVQVKVNNKDYLEAVLGSIDYIKLENLRRCSVRELKELTCTFAKREFCLPIGYRLVIGMGYPSPVENGFLFHHTYGIPYIPGEALKGITRHALLFAMYSYLYRSDGANLSAKKGANVKDYEGQLLKTLDNCLSIGRDKKSDREKSRCPFEVIDNDKNKIHIDDDLFKHLEEACLKFDNGVPEVVKCSSDSDLNVLNLFEILFGSQKKRGEVIFFDAFPDDLRGEHFELDIMNPHYGKYYEKKGDMPPADWYDPSPIVFLTLANAKFRFNIAYYPLNPVDESRSEKILDDAKRVLEFALTTYGIGGKTRSGYGWFEER